MVPFQFWQVWFLDYYFARLLLVVQGKIKMGL